MAITQATTRQLGANSVNKDDIDISSSTKAVVTKIIAGTNVTISQTGADSGTGEVTINASGGGGGGALTETALADGFTIAGGTTSRTLKVDGGDVEIIGGVLSNLTLPTGTETLIGRDTVDTLTNKTLSTLAMVTDFITTSGGTTTLTSSSNYYQNPIGTSAHTIVLPNATTLVVGRRFYIDNNSTQDITVKTNGGATLWVVAPLTDLMVVVSDISSAAGQWDLNYYATLASSGTYITFPDKTTQVLGQGMVLAQILGYAMP